MDSPSHISAETVPETAHRLAADFAQRAAQHDADDSYPTENFAALKSAGLIRAGVPGELGGGGAQVRDLCEMLRIIAHGCSSTALALAMHTHQVAIPAWRWTHKPEARPAVEPLLRRIAAENLLLISSGGSDWVGGSGTAVKVDGGYRISGRKIFGSNSVMGDMLMTCAVAEEDGQRKVLHFGLPMTAPGVKVLDTWRAIGMRATGSNDIEIDGAFVPDDKIALKRAAGEWHFLFQVIGNIAFPLIYAAYLGVAEQARDRAVALAARKPPSDRLRRLAGEMDTALQATRYAHRAMVEVAEQNAPSAESVNEVMIGRRLVEENALRTVELAMDLAGGVGFYRGAGLERLFRDIQAARYHPMNREAQYEYAGAMALGQPVTHIY